MPNVLAKNMFFQTIGIFRLIFLKVGFDQKKKKGFDFHGPVVNALPVFPLKLRPLIRMLVAHCINAHSIDLRQQ